MKKIKIHNYPGIHTWIFFVLLPYLSFISPEYTYSQQTYTWTGAADNLLETTSGEASYQWYFNTNPIAGATSSSYLAEINGEYQVLVTGVNGCSRLSDVYEHLAIAIEDNFFGHFLVFP